MEQIQVWVTLTEGWCVSFPGGYGDRFLTAWGARRWARRMMAAGSR